MPTASAILDGIFGDRHALVARLNQANDADTRQRAQKALRAYDFVYDASESREAVAGGVR